MKSKNSSKIIDFRKHLVRKRDREEEKFFEELEQGWEVYAELADIAPYLPEPILRKIQTLCQRLLEK